ncbi:hypothetical protein R1sor_024497 [Riccia sorocarpa]|uniref:RING-type domain-containing protein n=1 Tax=Riccia sorocarpa TaxID=122646 RepID=A0ABD3GSJ5_9MARC
MAELHACKLENADCEDKLRRELQSMQEELQQKQARKVDTDELKQILLEKESALRKLRTEEYRIAKSLNAAQKNVTKLEKALKKMPAGIVVKSDVKASEILKKGGTFQISLYPPSFNSTTASWTQRIKCPPVVCVLCRSLISPGAEIRIPECDHPYHVSCVCSSFGVNYLACWVENCESLAPISWVKEFGLHCQIDYDAILERVWTTKESRCFQDTNFMDAVDGEIAGAVAMQLRKKEWVHQLSKDVRSKRIQWLRGTKSRGLSKSFEGNVIFELQPPPHRLRGMQFNQWVESKSGTPIADWKRLWDYQNTDIWIWASRVPMFEVGIHNRCLQGVVLRHQAGSASFIESICRVNSLLSIRIRPFDGIFLDCFVQALLAVPWALEDVTRLVSHGLILIYRTGKIPLDVLLNQINYKLASDFDALSPLWRALKEWHETGSAPDVCSSVTSLEIQAGDIQAWLKFQP